MVTTALHDRFLVMATSHRAVTVLTLALAAATVSLATPAHASLGIENVTQTIGASGAGGNINNINAAKSDISSTVVRHSHRD
ncbi:hypothetical protein [Streptodolium elevatio]